MDYFNKEALKAVELHKKNKLNEAKIIYLNLIKIHPNNSQILRLLSSIEISFENYDVALDLLDRCISIDDNDAEAYSNRGIVFFKKKDIEKAKKDYLKSIDINNNLNALFNLANLYKEMNQLEESEKYFNKVISINPKHYKAFHNLAVVKNLQGKTKESISYFDRSIKINQYSESYFFKSLIQLKLENFEDGWKNYEWRWKTKFFLNQKKYFDREVWDGKQDLKNKTILLYGEQGLGDQIQFIRFAKIIEELGAKVFIEVDKNLVKLFQETSYFKNIYAKGDKIPEFNYCCPLMSLPLKLNINHIKNIPKYSSYLNFNAERVKRWENLFEKKKINIGINWESGSVSMFKGRSFKLNNFKNISLLKEVELFSLQKINGLEQIKENENQFKLNTFKNFDEEAPFVDTAAIMKNLDLIITSDTSIAHLSGALGKKTYLILQKNSEWRWLSEKKNSPWYPSFIIYRQKKEGNWEEVFNDIENDLKK